MKFLFTRLYLQQTSTNYVIPTHLSCHQIYTGHNFFYTKTIFRNHYGNLHNKHLHHGLKKKNNIHFHVLNEIAMVTNRKYINDIIIMSVCQYYIWLQMNACVLLLSHSMWLASLVRGVRA